MKIRQGFVSNSSSSSFIVAFKKKGKAACPTCNRSFPSIVELVSRAGKNNGDTSVDATGKEAVLEQIDSYIEDYASWGDETAIAEMKKVKDKLLELDKEGGWDFAEVGISYHDPVLNETLHGDSNIIVLYSTC